MVGKDWVSSGVESADFIEVGQLGGFVSFANVKEVFKPGTRNVLEAPKDLLSWLRHNPYLKTSKPEPVTLGGIKGEQLEASVDHLPKDYYGHCGTGRLDIYSRSGGEPVGFEDGIKTRIIVYEDINGETVANDIGVSGASEFEGFMSEANKVLATVKWGGS